MKTITLVLLLLLAPATAAAQASHAPVGAEREIAAVLDAQATAWNAGDIAGYMAGYWHSDSLLFTSGGNVRRGWQETYEKYAARYATRALMGTLTFSGLEYHILGGDAAWVFGAWSLAREKDRPHGTFTLILRRIDGAWKIVHDHTSSSPDQ